MNEPKPTSPIRPVATHVAVFLLGVLAGAAMHPCTVITSTPPSPVDPVEPAAADETGAP